MKCLITKITSTVLLVITACFFVQPNLKSETVAYVLKFPEGRTINFTPNSDSVKIINDGLKNSKFIITYNTVKDSAEIRGIGSGGNENYKANLVKVGNNKEILTFLEVYDTSSMMWTIWLNNSANKTNPEVKRAAYTAHKSSFTGQRTQTFWGTAINVDQALKKEVKSTPDKSELPSLVPFSEEELKEIYYKVQTSQKALYFNKADWAAMQNPKSGL